MKYLINSKTKEHKVCRPDTNYFFDADCRIVQADSEGWIKHNGGECPLPDDVRCAVKIADGSTCLGRQWEWETNGDMNHDITHYKPILEQAEPVKDDQYRAATEDCDREKELAYAEMEAERKHMEIKEAELKRMMLLDRLKAAHEAAQQIPDLEAELREVLWSMGYDLVA
jgi:hypothetical protein